MLNTIGFCVEALECMRLQELERRCRGKVRERMREALVPRRAGRWHVGS